jgi:hypothetical protein
MLNPTVEAAAVASAIAAGATVSGYLLTQSRARRERKATAFAEALTAVRRYQDFPYKVLRRTDDDPETRTRLGDEQTATGIQIQFHLVWLQVDAPTVSKAFEDLWTVVHAERQKNYRIAWNTPPRTTAAGMAEPNPFRHEVASPEMQLCILAMRNELLLLAPLRRRRIRRLIREQAARREAKAP